MPMGTKYRLTGLLLGNRRGFALRVDDGGVWTLDVGCKAERLLGRRVVVEGTRSGFDLLDVRSIAAEPGQTSD